MSSLHNASTAAANSSEVLVDVGLGAARALNDGLDADRVISLFEEHVGGDPQQFGALFDRTCLLDRHQFT